MTNRLDNPLQNSAVKSRQIAFFAAFVLPVYKLLETPSLLARFAKGDLLVPAFLHFVVQAALLSLLVYAASRSETSLFERLNARLGKWSALIYALLALYFLCIAVLPLLDLEKFVYAVFYDTSPTVFSFAAFFIFAAFACTKGLKTVGRSADLSLFLFLPAFLLLVAMSFPATKPDNLLPLFGESAKSTLDAFAYTTPHFADAVFLLPLIGNLRYQKGDGKKIVVGYGVGAAFVLVFLCVFFGLYSTIAPREHYAFSKIAQYFPVLSIVGRIDLIFVYMLCVVLFFYVATPLQYTVYFGAKIAHTTRKTSISAIVCFGAFLFVLFCNKHYNAIYALFCETLFPVFLFLSIGLPVACSLFNHKENRNA
ncbi:MAG: GerAB/ArcD/ProY family transporter [Clostridia bacterium]|nr:GerAB/ArcD/ProY family transporter [Clostridia bacterium]